MRVLSAALIAEGLLVVISLALQYLFDLNVEWNTSPKTILLGTLLIIPPLAVNHFLWGHSQRATHSIYYRFSQEIIIPLCKHITWQVAVLIAILSGVCEEMLFRGALNSLSLRYTNPALSCLLTSLLFAAVHFIGSFKRYGMMIPLYTAMGAYLWGVHYMLQSLSAVAILHGLYNFIVIVLVKKSIASALHVAR
jgi:membrane protease YdiL (CAAX protease family)